MTTTQLPDPTSLSLDELRALRHQLQLEDDAVSYARRVAQARLDQVVGRRAPPRLVGKGSNQDDTHAHPRGHDTGVDGSWESRTARRARHGVSP